MWSSWTPNENGEWVQSQVGVPGRHMPKQWGIWQGWDKIGPWGHGWRSSMCHFSYSQQTELCGRRNKTTRINRRLTTHMHPMNVRGPTHKRLVGVQSRMLSELSFFPGQCFVLHVYMSRYMYFTLELFSRHSSALWVLLWSPLLLCSSCSVCIAPNTS